MKKVLGVFITIFIFVLNFLNMTFANAEKLSKPPRLLKNTADSNRVDLQAGKPVPASKLGVVPRIRSTDDKHKVFPKVETDLNKGNMNLPGKVWPKVEMNLQEEVFPKVEMDYKFDYGKIEMND